MQETELKSLTAKLREKLSVLHAAAPVSAVGIGGRVSFRPPNLIGREGNPIRAFCDVTDLKPDRSSSVQINRFVGDVYGAGTTSQPPAAASNPWGRGAFPNSAGNMNLKNFPLTIQDMNSQFIIGKDVVEDIENLSDLIIDTANLQNKTFESRSCFLNNDKTASTAATVYGGTMGLRGFNSYTFSTDGSIAYDDNGYDTLRSVQTAAASMNSRQIYIDLCEMIAKLPSVYRYSDRTAFMISKRVWDTLLMNAGGSAGAPISIVLGEGDDLSYFDGIPVIVTDNLMTNPQATSIVAGDIQAVLGEWNRGFYIGERLSETTIAMQSNPGFYTFVFRFRVAAAVKNPDCFVVYKAT